MCLLILILAAAQLAAACGSLFHRRPRLPQRKARRGRPVPLVFRVSHRSVGPSRRRRRGHPVPRRPGLRSARPRTDGHGQDRSSGAHRPARGRCRGGSGQRLLVALVSRPRPREATCAAGSRRPSSWSPPKKRAALGLTGCSTCVWKIILSQWKNCAATEVVPDEATGGEAPFSVGVTLASEGREQEAAAYLLRALAQNDRRSAPSHGALNYSG